MAIVDSPKRPRRKYRFRDRAEAESHYREADQAYLAQLRLARALYSGSVKWGKARKPYRMGVYDRDTCGGPRIVLAFDPGGQEPSLHVLDPWGDDLQGYETEAVRYAAEPESTALLECIVEIRQIMGPLT